MPPRPGSRYLFCSAVQDDDGRWTLNERVPFGYQAFHDNRTHVVSTGDSLWGLAGLYFEPLPRACGFWWVIADFQPEPIVDATLQLEPGRRLVVPSLRMLTDVILGEPGRRAHA